MSKSKRQSNVRPLENCNLDSEWDDYFTEIEYWEDMKNVNQKFYRMTPLTFYGDGLNPTASCNVESNFTY